MSGQDEDLRGNQKGPASPSFVLAGPREQRHWAHLTSGGVTSGAEEAGTPPLVYIGEPEPEPEPAPEPEPEL